MKRMIAAGICSLSLMAMIGCTTDTAQIIEHPTTTQPGSTITVKLASAFAYGTFGKMYFSQVSRDSLHVLLGLPEGWSVEGIDCYVAKDYKAAKSLAEIQDFESLMQDPANQDLVQEFQDSLVSFELRKTPMPADPSLNGSLAGRSFTASAYDPSQGDIDVDADSITNWNAFSSKISLSYQAATKTDTFIVLDSAMKAAVQEGMPGMFFLSDTVGITVVPMFVFARIKTGDEAGEYQLYYYTKTNSIANYNDLDQGSMAYATVVLDPNAPVKTARNSTMTAGALKANPAVFSGSTRIQLPSEAVSGAKVSILSLRGQVIKSFGDISSGTSQISWDGTDQSGKRVKSGTYIVRYGDELNTSFCTVRKVK